MSTSRDPDEPRRPTVEDVDPAALAADSLDDFTRLHGDPDETSTVAVGGIGPVPLDEDGNPVISTQESDGTDPLDPADREE